MSRRLSPLAELMIKVVILSSNPTLRQAPTNSIKLAMVAIAGPIPATVSMTRPVGTPPVAMLANTPATPMVAKPTSLPPGNLGRLSAAATISPKIKYCNRRSLSCLFVPAVRLGSNRRAALAQPYIVPGGAKCSRHRRRVRSAVSPALSASICAGRAHIANRACRRAPVLYHPQATRTGGARASREHTRIA